jgi:ribosomal protein S18 acetylase RimI-like enzyme
MPFVDTWSEGEFLDFLRQRNSIGMVVEDCKTIVGFMLYRLEKGSLHIERIAVNPDLQRCGYGSRMIDWLKSKLEVQGRTALFASVHENYTPMHLLLRDSGFFCCGNIYDPAFAEYEYLFRFKLGEHYEHKSIETPYFPANRISDLAGGAR